MSTCSPLLLSHECQGKHRAVRDGRTEPHSGHSLLRHSGPELLEGERADKKAYTCVQYRAWPGATRPWGLRLGVFQETNPPAP